MCIENLRKKPQDAQLKFLLLSPSQLQRKLLRQQRSSKKKRYAEIVLKRQQCLFMLQTGLLSHRREFHERRLNSYHGLHVWGLLSWGRETGINQSIYPLYGFVRFYLSSMDFDLQSLHVR